MRFNHVWIHLRKNKFQLGSNKGFALATKDKGNCQRRDTLIEFVEEK